MKNKFVIALLTICLLVSAAIVVVNAQEPTPTPSEEPTPTPSEEPTPTPSEEPTPTPSEEPTPTPSEEPTPTPTNTTDPTPTPTNSTTLIPDIPEFGRLEAAATMILVTVPMAIMYKVKSQKKPQVS